MQNRINPISDDTKVYKLLSRIYGTSAATTYTYNRECGQPAVFAYVRMIAQVRELGTKYIGGLECTCYRRQWEA